MAPMAGAAPSAATQALPPQFETTCFAFNDTHFQARTAHRALRRGARRAAVRCVRALHEKGWVHRDIKSSNVVLADDAVPLDSPRSRLCVIDFGLSRRWFDPASGEAVPSAPRRGTVGTVRFASIANQQAQALGRRDDLESLAFTLVQLHHGELPWSHVQAPTKQERFRLMLACKLRVSVGELCTGLPALAEFVQAVRTLRPEERPDYDALRELLRTL